MRWIHAAATLVLLGSAACGGDDEPQQVEPVEDVPAPTSLAAPAADTTAAALWAHLQNANYRSWRRWPGKPVLYAGTEPRGMLLTT